MTRQQSPARETARPASQRGAGKTGAAKPAVRRQEPRLKQERALRTRQTILEAAAEVFAERNFPAVTILDIAERAGVTKGAVYFHFANKEAVAVAVAERFYEQLPEELAPALTTTGTPGERVADFMRSMARMFRDSPLTQAATLLQDQRWFLESDLPIPYEGFTETLAALLTEARDAGELPADADPQALARVLRSALFGAQHVSWVQTGWADIDERTEEIIEALPFLGARAGSGS